MTGMPPLARIDLEEGRARLAAAIENPPTAGSSPHSTPDRDRLRQQYADAALTVRLRLGPNAVAMAQRGEAIRLSGGEADECADAVLAVRDAALEELRRRAETAEAAIARVRTLLGDPLLSKTDPERAGERWLAGRIHAALDGPERRCVASHCAENDHTYLTKGD